MAAKKSSNPSNRFLTPGETQNWVRVEHAADLGNPTILPSATHGNRTRTALIQGVKQTGNSQNNVLSGTQNDDTLSGGGGNDRLSGLEGGDQLFGDGGNDRLFGGKGNDRLVGNSGSDRLRGAAGNDTIAGGTGLDQLVGAQGQDSLQGGGGDDRVVGGNNADTLEGGDGDDTLVGGSANDILVGGQGRDTLTGDAGRDVFAYISFDDRRDEITDFDDDQDQLDLSRLFQGSAYSSSDRLNEYVVIVNEEDEDTLIRVDIDGNNGDRPFVTLVSLTDVDFDDLGSRNFII